MKKINNLSASDLILAMEKKADNKACRNKRPILQKFFKTAKGEYAEGDILIGLAVPIVRNFATKYQSLKHREIKKLLNHKVHEIRLVGLLILVKQYQAEKDKEEKRKIVGFYLQHSHRINNWDLVDLSAYKILGDFLLTEAPTNTRALLKKLASSKNLWERRIAMVSTLAFIKEGRRDELILISKKLLSDTEDLIYKANGWMLREFGKKFGEKDLEEFLKVNIKNIPRVTLRYATEKFDKIKRMYYYNLNKKNK